MVMLANVAWLLPLPLLHGLGTSLPNTNSRLVLLALDEHGCALLMHNCRSSLAVQRSTAMRSAPTATLGLVCQVTSHAFHGKPRSPSWMAQSLPSIGMQSPFQP